MVADRTRLEMANRRRGCPGAPATAGATPLRCVRTIHGVRQRQPLSATRSAVLAQPYAKPLPLSAPSSDLFGNHIEHIFAAVQTFGQSLMETAQPIDHLVGSFCRPGIRIFACDEVHDSAHVFDFDTAKRIVK